MNSNPFGWRSSVTGGDLERTLYDCWYTKFLPILYESLWYYLSLFQYQCIIQSSFTTRIMRITSRAPPYIWLISNCSVTEASPNFYNSMKLTFFQPSRTYLTKIVWPFLTCVDFKFRTIRQSVSGAHMTTSSHTLFAFEMTREPFVIS